MTWSEFFSSQLFGVIIGSVITAGFTFLLDWLKSRRERKMHYIDKRNETYLNLIKLFNTLLDNGFHNAQLRMPLVNMIEEAKANIELYASQEIKDLLPSFFEFFNQDSDPFSFINEQSNIDILKGIFNQILLQISIETREVK